MNVLIAAARGKFHAQYADEPEKISMPDPPGSEQGDCVLGMFKHSLCFSSF
jgi:hypothetical protein